MILRVNLSNNTVVEEKLTENFRHDYIGGRGLASKILWDEVKNVDPLGPENKLIFALGPFNGLRTPSGGKMVIAAKSPLTNGYGDGNIGTMASVQLKKAGYTALVVEGSSQKPVYLCIEDDRISILDARELWGLDTFETERRLKEVHGKACGVLCIGPAGENKVKYAVIMSQRGRAGGRPGMGAVMGSKKLKAVVVKGTKEVPVADKNAFDEYTKAVYKEISSQPGYSFWMRQGTMAAVEWAHKNFALPTRNFSEGRFERFRTVDGYSMEAMKVGRRGCPYCNMQCGNIVLDKEGKESELDYENVGMLGPNTGLANLNRVAVLNRLADELGLDTISLGSALSFAMEARKLGILKDAPSFGEYEEMIALTNEIAHRSSKMGDLLAEGVRIASQELGAEDIAVHVKGLEVSAYNCFRYPAMALAYATSAIGAHHKEAWVIAWELGSSPMDEGNASSSYEMNYKLDKAAKVIEQQRIRGGMFEFLTACRLPWVELGVDLQWYPKILSAIVGENYTLDDIFKVSDRVYSLIRSFWIRELGTWEKSMDYPPKKWFKEDINGFHLEEGKYEELLQEYYRLRGWNSEGVPTKETLKHLGLDFVAEELSI